MTRLRDDSAGAPRGGVLQPPEGVGPFHWHKCHACQRLGYRKGFIMRGTRLGWNGIQLDTATYDKVVGWHNKVAVEMWADFVNTSVSNMKE